MENCGSAVISVIGFLRGRPINHDTPPAPQFTRSKPNRPREVNETFTYSFILCSPKAGDKASRPG